MARELLFAPLGGVGEIGMNLYLYGFGPRESRRWLILDVGAMFPREREPGIDLIFPDIRFIENNRANLVGIVITHAHEDHFGAVADLWPRLKAPIYATPFTAALLKSKLAEYRSGLEIPVEVVPLNARFRLPPFDIELITMPHSIPESSAVVIRTPLGVVLHSGDWRLDSDPIFGGPVDEARIRALGEEGVTAFVCVSTSALREGPTPPERAMAETLTEIIQRARKRVVVTTFASNISRIRAVSEATQAAGRQLIVVGRSMLRNIELAKQTGYLSDDLEFSEGKTCLSLPSDKVVVLCTGSQGQTNAAIARIAARKHPDVALDAGDLVIFSSWTIPGNEAHVAAVQNDLARGGCEIITDSDALVHVSGHPKRDELRQMYSWVKPLIAIPMHGEARHLVAHARLARSAGVREVLTVSNGQLVRIVPGPAAVIDTVPVGRLYRDGRITVGAEVGQVSARRKLAYAGIVVVSLVLSIAGELMAEPIAALEGVPADDAEGYPLECAVRSAIFGTLKSIPPSRRRDSILVREAVRRSVRAAVERAWGKRPIVKVLLSTIDSKV